MERQNFLWMLWGCLAVGAGERGDDGAVVGGLSPVGVVYDVGFSGGPFPGHAGAEQDIINSGIGVFTCIEVRPGDGAVGMGVGGGGGLFAGAGIDEFVFASADESA
ncbi:MAG: hypothetical protein RI897_178 [Verrucomicrobiota bacterium]